MSNTNTGGPAFPCEVLGKDELGEYRTPLQGMTLRDYFAASALSGLEATSGMEDDLAGYAAWAYRMADHMLMARKI
jgi:hypothetical protein